MSRLGEEEKEEEEEGQEYSYRDGAGKLAEESLHFLSSETPDTLSLALRFLSPPPFFFFLFFPFLREPFPHRIAAPFHDGTMKGPKGFKETISRYLLDHPNLLFFFHPLFFLRSCAPPPSLSLYLFIYLSISLSVPFSGVIRLFATIHVTRARKRSASWFLRSVRTRDERGGGENDSFLTVSPRACAVETRRS